MAAQIGLSLSGKFSISMPVLGFTIEGKGVTIRNAFFVDGGAKRHSQE